MTAALAATMMLGTVSYAANVSSGNSGETAQTETAADAEDALDIAYEQFFSDSVLIGDSVSQGFENYAMQSNAHRKEAGEAKDPLLGTMKFLTSSGYSLLGAFDPVSATSKHPIYKGKQRPVWESVQLMGARHVYLFFGINDLGGKYHPSWKYRDLIKKLKESSPDLAITILSATPTVKGGQQKGVNTKAIRALNAEMETMAKQNGWDYINLADRLSDAEGYLKPEYCSDGYVHETAEGYAVWTQVLKEYADAKLHSEKS